MTYDYEKLWKLLNEKGISKSNLKMIAHIGSATLAKMSKGQMVSMMVIEKICKALHCDIGEIMSCIPDEPAKLEASVPVKALEEKAADFDVSGSLVDIPVEKSAKYKSIDLFAGIGGIRLGFEEAFGKDISTEFVSEWDEYAQKTYETNFATPYTVDENGVKHTAIAGDITKIKESEIPAFDICLAGFPCQAFSIAGRHQGLNDDYYGTCRGTLFLDVARICDYHKPKVIFCENVKGLTIHDRGNTFKIITKTFEDLGYKVFSKVLNSKDFGVPQNRERIYIVCFRNDIAPETFSFPKDAYGKNSIREIMEEKEVSVKYYLSTQYLSTLVKHKERHRSKGNGFGYEIRDLDGVAGAIVCGGMGRERNLIVDKRLSDFTPVTHIRGEVNRDGIRKMTPREWARLQGFPDTFRIDQLADVHLYKQFGNSVSVPVIREIAKKIREVLEHGADRK